MAGELIILKNEMEILRKQLVEREKELANEKVEKNKLRSENMELKKKVGRLMEIARSSE